MARIIQTNLHERTSTDGSFRDSISICRTCPRDSEASGSFGRALTTYLETRSSELGMRVFLVTCLGSCKQPGAIVLDSPSKARLRFSGLTMQDAAGVVALMQAYMESNDGIFPQAVADLNFEVHLTAVSPKISSWQKLAAS